MKTKRILAATCAVLVLSFNVEAAPNKGNASSSSSQASARRSSLDRFLDDVGRWFGIDRTLPSSPKKQPGPLDPDQQCPIDGALCRGHMPIGG